MRVLHVYSGNLFGGIEAMLVTMARCREACASLEADVALCFDGRLARELTAAGVSVHQLGEVRASRPYTLQRARRELAELLARERFDRVICHASWSYALAAPIVRRARIPLVFWAHDALTGRHWTERWAKRTTPDLVIANSRYTASTVGMLSSDVDVEVIYPPVELPPSFSEAERLLVRGELETRADAVVVVQACRMDSWKGHRVLLAALAALGERPEWTCWLIGGAQRHGEERYVLQLIELTRQLQLSDRVRFAGERSDVTRLLSAADLLCQPNISPEPFGIAFVEALGAGLPVVTSRLGGATEIVDELCGRLVEPNDPVRLCMTLETLILDGDLRRRLAANAPERARALCDPASQVQRLHACLEAMTRQGRRGIEELRQ
jgi:glycosyltransferase involved in cell wall biosynthesis